MYQSIVLKDHLFKMLPWKLETKDSKRTSQLFICSLWTTPFHHQN